MSCYYNSFNIRFIQSSVMDYFVLKLQTNVKYQIALILSYTRNDSPLTVSIAFRRVFHTK